MENTIETVNLTKIYKGGVQALTDLNMKIKRGESIGFLGPNGAGKTTTIQILLNLLRPTKGEVYLFGEQMIGQERKVLRNVGALVEIPGFYEYLTPNDILTHVCRVYRMSNSEMKTNIDNVLQTLKIKEVKHKKIGTFSTGMKRRLAIAQTLVHNPELIILDEPTIGLDPRGVREIRDLIKEINKSGKTIFMTSHNLTEVSEISDRVIFLKKGVVIRDENMEELKQKLSSQQIEVKFLHPISTKEKDVILSIPGVIDIHDEFIEYSGNINTTQSILENLINNNIPVYSYTPRAMTLEELYLRLFKEEEDL